MRFDGQGKAFGFLPSGREVKVSSNNNAAFVVSENINPAAEAALELQACLIRGEFPFCFIGGLAVNRWGEPRYTQDADATVLTDFVKDELLVDFLLQHFAGRRPDVRDFALRARVLTHPCPPCLTG